MPEYRCTDGPLEGCALYSTADHPVDEMLDLVVADVGGSGDDGDILRYRVERPSADGIGELRYADH